MKTCSIGFVRGAICFFLLLTVACGPRETAEQKRREADSAAGRAGQVARKMAAQADKAGQTIGRQLMKAAHDAHEGWKEEGRKNSDKK